MSARTAWGGRASAYDQFEELLEAFEFVCFMRFSAYQQDGTPAPLLNFLSPKEHPSDDFSQTACGCAAALCLVQKQSCPTGNPRVLGAL